MGTNQIRRVERATDDSHGHHSTSPSFPATTLASIAACLLILLGSAFEAGMLGFGPYSSSGVWLISMISKNAWIMLSNLAAPEIRELLKIWPLTLVSLGSSILLIARRGNRFGSTAAITAGRKQNHAD